jgi:hypothetical protein
MRRALSPDAVLFPPGARPSARCWGDVAPLLLREEPNRPGTGWTLRRLGLTLGTLALAVLRGARRRRRPSPVIHSLVAADELRFAELCQQLAARRGVGQ